MLAAGLSLPAAAAPSAPQRALDAWTAGHSGTSALVVRIDPLGTDTVVASHRPERSLLPASTMKIVTSAGALLSLGPQFRFETRLYTSPLAARTGAVLNGPLYLRGAGDPVLATAGYARRYLNGRGGNLGRLADPLRASGVRLVRGPIVADASVFDQRRTGLQWRSYYSAYSAPLSGLAVNQNYAGGVRSRYVADPAVSGARELRAAMARRGVRHAGPLRAGPVPADAVELGSVTSPPLAQILGLMNPSSDNFVAEMLRKDVGAYAGEAGSTAEGNRVTTILLADRGVLAPDDRIVDGSGLSRANRLAPATLVRILVAAEREPDWGDALVRSLPRGGEGTLVRRFRGAIAPRVRAKTGYINGVSALAGVAVSPAGVRYAYALLMNESDIAGARAVQDRVVTLLAQGRADGAPGTPLPTRGGGATPVTTGPATTGTAPATAPAPPATRPTPPQAAAPAPSR